MGLGEVIKQGVIGFALYVGNWLLPANDDASISVVSIADNGRPACLVAVKMEMAVNPQLEELIDAGIPMRMRFSTITDENDSIVLYRTLFCNVASLKYHFSDSMETGVACSKEYPMILLALKDFCRWDFSVPRSAKECRTEIEILYSRVSQLNRTVDMSRVWGQKRIKITYLLERKKGNP
jgi:hypothetical protein